MSDNTGFVLTCALCLSAGVALVVTEHYYWAWIPFLALFCVSFKSGKCGCDEDKS